MKNIYLFKGPENVIEQTVLESSHLSREFILVNILGTDLEGTY